MRRTTQALTALALFAVTAAAATARQAGTNDTQRWGVDPAHTEIAFSIDAVGYPRTEGRFTRFDGRIAIDLDRPERSRVAFHVETRSVDVGSSSFSDYLRSAAFLDAARYPSIDFVSTSVAKLNDHAIRVSGELTLLGVTKPLDVDVEVKRLAGGHRFGFVADADIDRLAFGMTSGFPLVSRDVALHIASEAAEL
jgi:polyisoprenoid-binding protein YceI